MRKPAPLRLDSTYNGEEEEEKRNGMAPRADNEQQPDEDDGGKVRDKADRRVLSLRSKTGLGALDCYPTITFFHTPITKLRAEFLSPFSQTIGRHRWQSGAPSAGCTAAQQQSHPHVGNALSRHSTDLRRTCFHTHLRSESDHRPPHGVTLHPQARYPSA